LRTKLELSYIFISHDISVVKYVSDKIIVMDKGQIKEYEESDNLYKNPKSSITKQLVNSIPGIEYRKLR
jgi:peptide/nickel transport system ATP-binding protein